MLHRFAAVPRSPFASIFTPFLPHFFHLLSTLPFVLPLSFCLFLFFPPLIFTPSIYHRSYPIVYQPRRAVSKLRRFLPISIIKSTETACETRNQVFFYLRRGISLLFHLFLSFRRFSKYREKHSIAM